MSRFSVPKITTELRITKTFIDGELVYDRDEDALYVGDGTTAGGVSYKSEVSEPVAVNTDYTAFEVYATDTEIAAGDIDPVTGLEYKIAVPAGMTHKFRIKSDIHNDDVNSADVIIDWGDSTTSSLGEFESSTYDENNAETLYLMSHTYTAPGRYIVKILGKDYFGLAAPSSEQNLYNRISRFFEHDLPISHVITNLASFCQGSLTLQKVVASRSTDLFTRIDNITSIFSNCSNLISATNFKSWSFQFTRFFNSVFQNCISLQMTDFVLPDSLVASTGYRLGFYKCSALAVDIANLLPANGFSQRIVSVDRLFYNASSLTGTVPANILWEDTTKIWKNTDKCFAGCSAEIRAQVPTSWGGTNNNIIIPSSVNSDTLAEQDYTAFEVYPTSTNIAVGDIDSVSGLEYKFAVTANMTHQVTLKTTVENTVAARTAADVVIDWGDGTVETLSDYSAIEDKWEDKKQVWYTMSHTYTATGRYIVKILGKDYYGVQHSATNNCLCRAFDNDLPVASCVKNLSKFCNSAMKLQNIHVPSGFKWYSKMANCYGIFYSCKNLLSATGLEVVFMNAVTVKEMFNDCRSLTNCDFILPTSVVEADGYQRVFRNCYVLAVDIETLFPAFGFANRIMRMKDCFSNCAKLTGTVPAEVLWEDTSKVWKDESSILNSVSATLKEQIPVSWGGTMADPSA